MVVISLSIGLITWVLVMVLFVKVVVSWWVLPVLALQKLKRNGFRGPPPSFPLGNIAEMKRIRKASAAINADPHSFPSSKVSHDIHSTVFPHFAQWQASYGNQLNPPSLLYLILNKIRIHEALLHEILNSREELHVNYCRIILTDVTF